MKLTIDVPEIFSTLKCPECVWTTAIHEFNNRLNERATVTEQILGKPVDILQVERKDACVTVKVVVKKEDVEAFEDVWLKLRGNIDFNQDFSVGAINISNFTYKNATGEITDVLNKS
jgi:hypothetical protein